jgi:hypothetical protein
VFAVAVEMGRMQVWMVVLAWFLNVLVLSLALAIFEILIEKQNGWASAANPNGWGRKLFGGSILSRVCEKHYLTVYHVFVFAVVVPMILWGELLLVESFGIGHPVFSRLFASSQAYWVMRVDGVALIPLLFLTAAWFSILVVEDALWFLLNWYYPTSMEDLLSGNIWWHTRWLTLGSIKLPRFYVTTPVVAVAFLVASLAPPWLSPR